MNSPPFSSWHVGVAAEAFAAGLFARCGFDVSVQYGANQPEYDLLVAKAKDENVLKVSVKGSKDSSWRLTLSYLPKRTDISHPTDYHSAADRWLQGHGKTTLLCLVQFHKTQLTDMPRVYLATAAHVAQRLKATANGRGDTILYERKAWTARAHGAGTVDEIPVCWAFSHDRVDALYDQLFPSASGPLSSGGYVSALN